MIRAIVQVSDVAPKHLVKHWGHFFFKNRLIHICTVLHFCAISSIAVREVKFILK